MNRKLGREIRDDGVLQFRKTPRHPRVACGSCGIQPLERSVVGVQEILVAGHLLEALERHEPQHLDRVVRGRSPELIVQIAKNLARVVMPAPPEICGELVETAQPFGKGRQIRVPGHRTIDGSRPRSLASMKLRRYCLSAGVRAAIHAVATRHPMPPVTTDPRAPIHWATAPASSSPSWGPPWKNTMLMPVIRPRR